MKSRTNAHLDSSSDVGHERGDALERIKLILSGNVDSGESLSQLETLLFNIRKSIESVLNLSELVITQIKHWKGRRGTEIRLGFPGDVVEEVSLFPEGQGSTSSIETNDLYLAQQEAWALNPISIQILEKVCIPPDEQAIIQGNGEGLNVRKFFNRGALIYEVLNMLQIPLEQCVHKAGTNTPNMMRPLTYEQLILPTLNKIIQFCNLVGERTFVIHSANNPDHYFGKRKQELKADPLVSSFTGANPEVWKEVLCLHLRTFDASSLKREEVSNTPQATKKGEWRGFYMDEEGKHWGGVKTLAEKLGTTKAIISTIDSSIKPNKD